MDCRTQTAIAFRSRLGFKQHDLRMTKVQLVLTRIVKTFTNEEILVKYSVLNYFIDLYFPKHKLAIEFDEKGRKDRDEEKENIREKK